jgi:glycerol-3-phosphate acyltransferase PlsY
LSYLVTALGAYLLGSIPTGFLVAKAKGIDIRSVGSGNIGATNAMRVLGKPVGIAVLLVDALKGFAAVAWLMPAIYNQFAPRISGLVFYMDAEVMKLMVLAGVCAVLGHNYTCWLKFKGGKGIATSAGVFLALAPLALGVAFVVFVGAVLVTRYVSVGSIAAGLALPIAVWFTRESMLLRVVTIALGALAIYKHKANIGRLMAGTENRIGKKPEATK